MIHCSDTILQRCEHQRCCGGWIYVTDVTMIQGMTKHFSRHSLTLRSDRCLVITLKRLVIRQEWIFFRLLSNNFIGLAWWCHQSTFSAVLIV